MENPRNKTRVKLITDKELPEILTWQCNSDFDGVLTYQDFEINNSKNKELLFD